jgi:hypothetical protein
MHHGARSWSRPSSGPRRCHCRRMTYSRNRFCDHPLRGSHECWSQPVLFLLLGSAKAHPMARCPPVFSRGSLQTLLAGLRERCHNASQPRRDRFDRPLPLTRVVESWEAHHVRSYSYAVLDPLGSSMDGFSLSTVQVGAAGIRRITAAKKSGNTNSTIPRGGLNDAAEAHHANDSSPRPCLGRRSSAFRLR